MTESDISTPNTTIKVDSIRITNTRRLKMILEVLDSLSVKVSEIEYLLNKNQSIEGKLMSQVDDLTASVTQLQGTLTQFVSDSQAASAEILKELQNPTPDLSKVTALVTSINQSATSADSALQATLAQANPVTPVTPTPTPSDTKTSS